MALSVRPGSSLLISLHLLPSCWCCTMMTSSSCGSHTSFLMSGLRWLCHLSLHCFPVRPCRCVPTRLHFLVPWRDTRWMTWRSSSRLQGLRSSSGVEGGGGVGEEEDGVGGKGVEGEEWEGVEEEYEWEESDGWKLGS